MAGVVKGTDGVRRCAWGASTPDYAAYHDDEWGRPVIDDTRLYEKLCLEGFQAGLSWLTILRKRENFRKAFKGFDPMKARGSVQRDVERLMEDAGIVRNRAKIEATIANAAETCVVEPSTDRWPRCSGRSNRAAAGRRCVSSATSRRRPPSRRRHPRRCCVSGSASSGRRRSSRDAYMNAAGVTPD